MRYLHPPFLRPALTWYGLLAHSQQLEHLVAETVRVYWMRRVAATDLPLKASLVAVSWAGVQDWLAVAGVGMEAVSADRQGHEAEAVVDGRKDATALLERQGGAASATETHTFAIPDECLPPGSRLLQERLTTQVQ